MAFPAKYPGFCSACNGRFPAGEMIHWQKNAAGKGVSTHLACAPASAARPQAPAARPQGVLLATQAQWTTYVAGLAVRACSGCEDGCRGCDSSDGMGGW